MSVTPAGVAVGLGHVHKTYGGDQPVVSLDDMSAVFTRGTATAVMGPSGSGKSTLLHCAAGLDRPDSGSVRIGRTDLASLSEKRLTELRRDRVGFVFQAFNLVGALDVERNILLPSRLSGRRPDPAWTAEAVGRVGLGDRLRHRPAQLSGGGSHGVLRGGGGPHQHRQAQRRPGGPASWCGGTTACCAWRSTTTAGAARTSAPDPG